MKMREVTTEYTTVSTSQTASENSRAPVFAAESASFAPRLLAFCLSIATGASLYLLLFCWSRLPNIALPHEKYWFHSPFEIVAASVLFGTALVSCGLLLRIRKQWELNSKWLMQEARDFARHEQEKTEKQRSTIAQQRKAMEDDIRARMIPLEKEILQLQSRLYSAGRLEGENKLRLMTEAFISTNDVIMLLEEVSSLPSTEGKGKHAVLQGLRILYVNPAVESVMGYRDSEITRHPPLLWQSAQTDCTVLSQLQSDLALMRNRRQAGDFSQVELLTQHRDGRPLWIELTLRPIVAENRITHWMSVQRDITDRRIMEENRRDYARQMAWQAIHDELTGNLNRRGYEQQLDALLPKAQKDRPAAILFLDLDNFKHINDTLGHVTGDMLLKAVSERIQMGMDEGDLIARMGGDEFTLFLPILKNRKQGEERAQKILELLRPTVGSRTVSSFRDRKFGNQRCPTRWCGKGDAS